MELVDSCHDSVALIFFYCVCVIFLTLNGDELNEIKGDRKGNSLFSNELLPKTWHFCRLDLIMISLLTVYHFYARQFPFTVKNAHCFKVPPFHLL